MEVSGQFPAPYPLSQGMGSSGNHGTEDWVGSRAGLDVMEKEKIFCPC
jgi:hypothetical protein